MTATEARAILEALEVLAEKIDLLIARTAPATRRTAPGPDTPGGYPAE